MDEHGVRPEAFAAACRSGAKFLYCVPTLHNPTTATMKIRMMMRWSAFHWRVTNTLV